MLKQMSGKHEVSLTPSLLFAVDPGGHWIGPEGASSSTGAASGATSTTGSGVGVGVLAGSDTNPRGSTCTAAVGSGATDCASRNAKLPQITPVAITANAAIDATVPTVCFFMPSG